MTSWDFADVTLVCDDKKKIRAHRNILAACSPVFKDILQIENSSIIYLKGINLSEMEAILQFMYLGEATFLKEKMNLFLDVARTLEIKELNKEEVSEEERCVEEYSSVNDQNKENDLQWEEHKVMSSPKQKSPTQSRVRNTVANVKGQYTCYDCAKTFRGKSGLDQHYNAVHEGITFDCSYCDYKATLKGNLKRHIVRNH